MGDVLAVAKNHRVTASEAIGPQRVDQITAGLSTRAWNRYSAGEGAKGPREYERAGTDDQRGDQTLDFVDGDRDQVGLGGVVLGGGPGLVVVGEVVALVTDARLESSGLADALGGKPAQVARPAHDPPVVAERPDWITGVVRGPNCVDDQWSVGQPVEVDVAEDGVEWSIVSDGQQWRVAWYPPPLAPPGTRHGSAGICVAADQAVLVSSDGVRWGLPAGDPSPARIDWPRCAVRSQRRRA